MNGKRQSAGFSLFELMVVVTVIGILAAFAAPAIRETLVNARLRSETQLLLGTLQWSRAEAVRRNTCVGIIFDPAAASYTAFADDGADGGTQCDRIQQGGEVWLRTIELNPDVNLVGTNFPGGASLCFNANGTTCQSLQGNVSLGNQQRTDVLTVSASGGLRVRR